MADTDEAIREARRREYTRKLIKELLRDRSQRSLAGLTGVPQSRISDAAGHGRLSVRNLLRLVKFAGRPPEDVYAFLDDKPSQDNGDSDVQQDTAKVAGRRIYIARVVPVNGCGECKYRADNVCALFSETLFARQRDGVVEFKTLYAFNFALDADEVDREREF